MDRAKLVQLIRQRKNFLCVGLDTDIKKLPGHFSQSPESALEFNRQIIDATRSYCVSYKLNTAFYEAMGWKGWKIMDETIQYIGNEHFIIADAKRGDIGNTADMYARAFFEELQVDAVTLSPYMGIDTLAPFFKDKNKWGIILALTSNPGSADFEQQIIGNETLYQMVIKKSASLAHSDNSMFVVGATKPEELGEIRKIIPNHFLLVPGVGAQGGSLQEVLKYGLNADIGLLINASRSIIYASSGENFAEAAQAEAKRMAEEMESAFAHSSNLKFN